MASTSRLRALILGGDWMRHGSPLLSECISRPDKDITHLNSVILHQMFVEGVDDLQPNDEDGSGYILVTIVYQGHLTLKIVDVILLPRFHLNYEESCCFYEISSEKQTCYRIHRSCRGSFGVNSSKASRTSGRKLL